MKSVIRTLALTLLLVFLCTASSLAKTNSEPLSTTEPAHQFVLFSSHYSLPLDKEKHILAGMTVMAASRALNLHHNIELVALVGVGKEVYDHFYGGHVELIDALATLGGGLLYQSLFR